jgi:hypothetical protein
MLYFFATMLSWWENSAVNKECMDALYAAGLHTLSLTLSRNNTITSLDKGFHGTITSFSQLILRVKGMADKQKK